MTTPKPFDYMEWVDVTLDGWVLKTDAPIYVIEAFKLWMENLKPMD